MDSGCAWPPLPPPIAAICSWSARICACMLARSPVAAACGEANVGIGIGIGIGIGLYCGWGWTPP